MSGPEMIDEKNLGVLGTATQCQEKDKYRHVPGGGSGVVCGSSMKSPACFFYMSLVVWLVCASTAVAGHTNQNCPPNHVFVPECQSESSGRRS